MYTHQTSYRVRYADTDQMGFVYYGNYARFYEIGRVEALRNLGLEYAKIEEMGIYMPVYEMKTRYLSPAFYDNLLTIKTMISEIPKAKIVFNIEIINADQKVINRGEVTLVFLRRDNNKLTIAPKALVECFNPSDFKTNNL
jgi:acyl-CoA thioester hydrolase